MSSTTSHVGRIVHISRGYTVAEIVEPQAGGEDRVLGYGVFGHRSDTAMLYGDPDKAIAALTELANATDADLQAAARHRR